jgi:hypothetical protein
VWDNSSRGQIDRRRIHLPAADESSGRSSIVGWIAPEYAEVKERYLARFPQSAMMVDFADFSIWELRLQGATWFLDLDKPTLSEATSPLTWMHQKPRM